MKLKQKIIKRRSNKRKRRNSKRKKRGRKAKGAKGISNKVTNKINDNNGYIDVYPNGEAYKFLSSKDDEEKKEKPKKVVYNKISELDKAKIEEIKKKDENDIVNIINKGLKENQ